MCLTNSSSLRRTTPLQGILAGCKNENLQARQPGCINHEVLKQHDLKTAGFPPPFLALSFGKGRKLDFMLNGGGGGGDCVWVG